MKKLTIATALILTVITSSAPKAQAAAVFLGTTAVTGVLYISATTAAVGDATANKQAEAVMADSADYLQTGSMSLLLESGVAFVQSEDQSLSVDEAVDVLVERSAKILGL